MKFAEAYSRKGNNTEICLIPFLNIDTFIPFPLYKNIPTQHQKNEYSNSLFVFILCLISFFLKYQEIVKVFCIGRVITNFL